MITAAAVASGVVAVRGMVHNISSRYQRKAMKYEASSNDPPPTVEKLPSLLTTTTTYYNHYYNNKNILSLHVNHHYHPTSPPYLLWLEIDTGAPHTIDIQAEGIGYGLSDLIASIPTIKTHIPHPVAQFVLLHQERNEDEHQAELQGEREGKEGRDKPYLGGMEGITIQWMNGAITTSMCPPPPPSSFTMALC